MMSMVLFRSWISKEWLFFDFIFYHYSFQILLIFGLLLTNFLDCRFKNFAVFDAIKGLFVEIHVFLNYTLLVFLVCVIFFQNIVTIEILFFLLNYYRLICCLLSYEWLRSAKLLLLIYPLELHLLFPLFLFDCFLSLLLVELLCLTISEKHKN